MGGTILRVAMVMAAASALSAAELPAHVRTYQGSKPAPKDVPKSVPAYRLQPASPRFQPRLVRPGMNAPRPGVAIPGAAPGCQAQRRHTAQPPQSGSRSKTR